MRVAVALGKSYAGFTNFGIDFWNNWNLMERLERFSSFGGGKIDVDIFFPLNLREAFP
jgi:hypothetical protein